MVDKPKLDQMLTNLRQYVKVLKDIGSTPRREFLQNGDRIGNAKYHFIIAIECCIDIANHIIASENYRLPKDNADSFVVLTEQGILPEDLKESLQAAAKFRNRLVHLYWDVDDERVFTYLEESLADFGRFASELSAHID